MTDDAFAERRIIEAWRVRPANRHYSPDEEGEHDTGIAAAVADIVVADGAVSVPLVEIVPPEESIDALGTVRYDAWTALAVSEQIRCAAERALNETDPR